LTGEFGQVQCAPVVYLWFVPKVLKFVVNAEKRGELRDSAKQIQLKEASQRDSKSSSARSGGHRYGRFVHDRGTYKLGLTHFLAVVFCVASFRTFQ
jgi:hypothetical protein